MIHTFQMTNDTDARGYIILRNHVLVHLRFAEVYDFKCDSFYSKYKLFERCIAEVGGDESKSLLFQVDFGSVFGTEGIFFKCRRMELVAVRPCDAAGEAIAS